MAKFKIFFIGSLLFITLFSLKSCKKKAAVRGCTDTKATNYNLNATEDDGSCVYPPASKVVGDTYQGGLIFYVDGTGQHGLISTTADNSVSGSWSNGTNVFVDHTNKEVSTGIINTSLIVAKQGVGTYAASICNDFSSGGYSDWFLPSKDELTLIYSNLYKKGLGGFTPVKYWTSTEINTNDAICIDFNTGLPVQLVKTTLLSVRAVRQF